MFRATFILAIVPCLLFAGVVSSQAQDVTVVSGVIATRFGSTDEAVISGAEVVLTGAGIVRRTTAAGDGAYSFSVPPGRYRVVADAVGFCRSKRASFTVSSSPVTINVLLYPCAIVSSIVVDQAGNYSDYCYTDDPLRTTEFRVAAPGGATTDLLLRYGRHVQTRHGVSLYAPPPDDSLEFYVIASIGTVTVYADAIHYNSTAETLVARGRVLVDNGSERIYGSEISVTLDHDELEVTRNK